LIIIIKNMAETDRSKYIAALKTAWRKEQASRRIYQALADREDNPSRKQALVKLAETERGHAERWERQLKELGTSVGEYQENLADRIWRWVLVQSGTDNALARIESAENDDVDMYAAMADMAPDQDMREEVKSVRQDEALHSKAAHQAKTGTSGNDGTDEKNPQSRLDTILNREDWHKRGGGWIGQAIYGANDGLGSVFGIVSGVAGATAGGPAVLIAGLAGMMASALSMGSGAYLATKAQREVYEAEMRREKQELQNHPDEEQEELELFYQLKGMTPEMSKQMAKRLIGNKDVALQTLASEELGLNEQTFPNPWKEAISASLSTASGAFIPIIPFFFGGGYTAVIISFAISIVAHFLIGSAKTIVTGLNPWRSGLEMMLVGMGEAVVTYALGLLFGRVAG